MMVTSGSMLNVSVWRELGRFDDGLFIDYIDTDFCLRVLKSGRKIAVSGEAILEHRLGARERRVFAGKVVRPTHHAPFRHYYMARNRVLMWRRHALDAPHWAAFDFCFAGFNTFRIFLFEHHRWEKAKAILRGTWDGFLGKRGRMPS